jgi:uncharacterized membrane protein YeaQ/YmgE (transglycosylase-associated protein family)
MDIVFWAMLGGIVGWLASFFTRAYQKLVMCLDVELMTIGAALSALPALISSGAAQAGASTQSSLLILFLSALE